MVLEDKRHNKYYTFDARQKETPENTAVNGQESEINLDITPSDENVNKNDIRNNSKLYSINERGEERPYSNRELDKMLDNAEENKEALIDLYYNHRHKYLGRNGERYICFFIAFAVKLR